jgi:hypothetical protein
MSETPDPLEAELSALRPHPVTPGLRQRIAERLAEDPPATRQRLWWIALVGGAAACLAAVLLWWAVGRRADPPPIAQPRPTPPAEVAASWPTVLEYERALARSPEELDDLLNRHAPAAPQPDPQLARIGAFTRSDAALKALLGDD